MMRNCVWKASLYFFILSLAISAVPADAKSPENNAAEKSSDAVASLPLKAYAAFLNNADASVSFYSTDEAVYTPEIELHPFMEEFVKDYLKKNSEMLEKIKQKSDSYFSLMDKVFDKYDLPQELKYLAVIESRLKSSATSRVGAAGLWQLMPGTARVLGLKVTGTTDERRYAQKSSVAAAIYLNDLYKQFGDWLLVIAAYNSGPGGVLKAIKKSGSRDFWKLQQFLPKETRMHVKKFIATHYFFEEKGSLVTLTKSETEKYLEAIKGFLAKQNGQKPTDSSGHKYFDWVAVTHDHNNKLKFIARR